MSFLNQMYQKSSMTPVHNKNPNRVSGGLRAQGRDHVTFIKEDGTEQSIATTQYVESLEHRIRSQHERVARLEHRIQAQHDRFTKLENRVNSQTGLKGKQ